MWLNQGVKRMSSKISSAKDMYQQVASDSLSVEIVFSALSDNSGSVIEVNDTTSTLQLSNVSDKTISFSDRPNRIVTASNTTDFIGNWSVGANNFAVDPPNAVLVLDNVLQRLDLSEIQLFNPEYDSEANTLKYDISAENATSIDLPDKFGLTTMIIDGGGLMQLTAYGAG